MAANVRITGVRELQRKLKQAGPLATVALAAAAYEEQERVRRSRGYRRAVAASHATMTRHVRAMHLCNVRLCIFKRVSTPRGHRAPAAPHF